ncbi:thiamine-phosphate kinase [Pseudalkalibacillus caeni]|uniref:thiamine-phosphate kinase n=1 Tax=Exobacillus caeni TaxID=2574798 RepID=UPI0026A3A822
MRDEFEFIKSISPTKTNRTDLVQGIGDDAALVRGSSELEDIICMDTMAEGVHFKKETMSPYHTGYKALASNISDIAAMGGDPSFYLVSVAIPKEGWTEEELSELYRGMAELSESYKMDLIGGDTVSTSGGLVVTVTVMGKVKRGRHLLRENARDGDVVFVTGPLGGSAAGLQLLLEKEIGYPFNPEEKKLVDAHQMPQPRVDAGRILAKTNARVALNDISDGIASEANEIAEASELTIELEYENIPKYDGHASFSVEEQKSHVLYGGEDYELVGTISADKWDDLVEAFKEQELAVYRVGNATRGKPGVILKHGNQTGMLGKTGFNHFSK